MKDEELAREQFEKERSIEEKRKLQNQKELDLRKEKKRLERLKFEKMEKRNTELGK